MAILWIVAGDEVVEIAAFERIFFKGEVFVGAQIIDLQLRRPRFFGGGFAVKEKDIRLHALRVEDAGGQTQ